MLRKYPKGKGPDATYFSRMGPFVKGFIVLEVAFFGATFLLWNKMNRSRELNLISKEDVEMDFRYKVHKHCPSVLNMYYKVGELMGDFPARSLDYEAWNIKSD